MLDKSLDNNYIIIINNMTFEWDEEKAKSNLKKHSVNFESAAEVFSDENALMIPDPDHSETEERFIIIGSSSKLECLTVCHCYRDDETIIRIISARKATKNESREYARRLT